MMWGYHDAGGWDGGWWIAMWLMMVLFWAFVAAGAVWLFTSVRRNDRRDQFGSEAPEEILARRLAAGDISQEQYRTLRDELSLRHSAPT